MKKKLYKKQSKTFHEVLNAFTQVFLLDKTIFCQMITLQMGENEKLIFLIFNFAPKFNIEGNRKYSNQFPQGDKMEKSLNS